MSNEKKVYFLSPTWDYAPDGGPIQLGNIITSPKRPADPLNNHRHPRPSGDSLYPPNYKYHVTWDRNKHKSGKFGVWAKFLSTFFKFGISQQSDDESVFQFERMETEEFMPTDDYLREQMAASEVVHYLASGQPVYMITAVKAVYGARAKSAENIALLAQLNTTINGATPGASDVLGSKLGASKQNTQGVVFEESSPFVFAFRLRKVIVHENVMSTEEYTRGAMYGLTEQQDAEVMPFHVEGVAKSDATPGEFYLDRGEEVIDGENEEWVCVVALV